MQPTEARRLWRILAVQTIVGVMIAAAVLCISSHAALSALTGVGAGMVGTLVSGLWVFRDYRAQEPARITMRIYIAEAVRIALVAGIMVAALVTINGLDARILFGAFLVAQVVSPMVAARFDTPPSPGSGERNQK